MRHPPRAGFSLEEQTEPNPCAEALAPLEEYAAENRYENVLSEARAVDAAGVFRLYGFSASLSDASHLLYRVSTRIRRSRLDTLEYQQCCRERNCGWGYVSNLLAGEGEYVSAYASESSAGIEGPSFELDGQRAFRVLQRREVRGWIAAVLAAHARTEAVRACPPEEEWHGGECVALDWIGTMKAECRVDAASNPFWADDASMQRMLRDKRERACAWLEQHEISLPESAGK